MIRQSTMGYVAGLCLLVALAVPRMVSAAPPNVTFGNHASAAAVSADLALDTQHRLHGTVLSASGTPVAETPVRLVKNQIEIGRAVTDGNGRFSISGVRGGTYILASGDSAAVYRIWASATAPPAAAPHAVLYQHRVVRGQYCSPGAPCGAAGCPGCGGGRRGLPGHVGGKFGGINMPSIHPLQWLHHPAVIGAAIGGAIALPIALHDNEFAS